MTVTVDPTDDASRQSAHALRRRAVAARRLPALDGRHGGTLAALDPALTWPPAPRTPSTYSLSDDERRDYARALIASGWDSWEVRQVLAAPEPVAA